MMERPWARDASGNKVERSRRMTVKRDEQLRMIFS